MTVNKTRLADAAVAVAVVASLQLELAAVASSEMSGA